MYLKLLALFTFLSAAFSQAITNVTYTDLLCASSSNTTSLARGATAYLCVHFITYEASSKSYVPQRAVFPLTVDDFTSVQVLGGQSTFTSLGNFSQVVAQVQGIVQSTPLTYYQLANSFYSSAFSIVIQLDMGNITSVIWDHQCATCGSSECYAFTSGSSNIDSICNTPSCVTTNDSSTCDPQIFVTWIGSDVNNVKMTSASMRLSRFRQFSTSELLSASTIPDFVPVVPSANSTNSSSNTTNNTTPSGDDTDNEPNNNNPSSGNQNNGQTNTTTNSSNDETDNEPNNNNPSPSENQSASEQQNTQTGSETNGSGTQTETNTNGSGTETSGSGSETGTNTNGSGTETGTNTNGSGTQAGTETNGSGNENGSGTGTSTSTSTSTNTNTNTNTTTNTNTNTNTSGSGNGGTDQSDEEGSGQNNPTPTVG